MACYEKHMATPNFQSLFATFPNCKGDKSDGRTPRISENSESGSEVSEQFNERTLPLPDDDVTATNVNDSDAKGERCCEHRGTGNQIIKDHGSSSDIGTLGRVDDSISLNRPNCESTTSSSEVTVFNQGTEHNSYPIDFIYYRDDNMEYLTKKEQYGPCIDEQFQTSHKVHTEDTEDHVIHVVKKDTVSTVDDVSEEEITASAKSLRIDATSDDVIEESSPVSDLTDSTVLMKQHCKKDPDMESTKVKETYLRTKSIQSTGLRIVSPGDHHEIHVGNACRSKNLKSGDEIYAVGGIVVQDWEHDTLVDFLQVVLESRFTVTVRRRGNDQEYEEQTISIRLDIIEEDMGNEKSYSVVITRFVNRTSFEPVRCIEFLEKKMCRIKHHLDDDSYQFVCIDDNNFLTLKRVGVRDDQSAQFFEYTYHGVRYREDSNRMYNVFLCIFESVMTTKCIRQTGIINVQLTMSGKMVNTNLKGLRHPNEHVFCVHGGQNNHCVFESLIYPGHFISWDQSKGKLKLKTCESLEKALITTDMIFEIEKSN